MDSNNNNLLQHLSLQLTLISCTKLAVTLLEGEGLDEAMWEMETYFIDEC
jgi:hypothetical protein